jgi:hypothetical protein
MKLKNKYNNCLEFYIKNNNIFYNFVIIIIFTYIIELK